MRAAILRLTVIALALASFTTTARAADNEKLAKAAYAVFEKNCAMCHHEDRNGNDDYDVLSFASITGTKPSGEILAKYKKAAAYIKPGKPDESLVLLRVGDKSMPKGKKALADADRQALVDWVKAGAEKAGFGK